MEFLRPTGQLGPILTSKDARYSHFPVAEFVNLIVPIRNLLVEVFDQDRSIEERLGSAISDARGEFALNFEEEDFLATRERGAGEIRPNLFCRARSASGELLAQTEVRKEVGREETFSIVVECSAEKTRTRFEKNWTILTRTGDTLQSPENSPSSSTVCSSMTLSSAGVRME